MICSFRTRDPGRKDLDRGRVRKNTGFLAFAATGAFVRMVLTTGGTGPAPRDLTPEATQAVLSKELPGFGELMRRTSLDYVATAILSRQTAGIRGKTFILNLPGSPASIDVCLTAVFAAVPYCLDLIGAGYIETDPAVLKAHRPGR